jgi:hypothetical protein
MTVKSFTAWALHSALHGALTFSARQWFHALDDPLTAQHQRLRATLAAVDGSRQADRIPGFARILSARDFQAAVPFCTYEGLSDDIEDMKRGVPGVLTNAPVVRFEKSGGSAGASKYIPYTQQLLQEFHAALAPWLWDLYGKRPVLKSGPSYWSISPIGRKREQTVGGIPVGTDTDGSYFPKLLQPLLSQIVAVPSALAHLPDVDSCRYATLRLLLERPDLTLISIWNPSFLTLMVEVLQRHAEHLIDDLELGVCRLPDVANRRDSYDNQRATADAIIASVSFTRQPQRAQWLRTLLRNEGYLRPSAVWPQLALISTWTDALAAQFLPPLTAQFPGIEIQGKGLLATEGVTTVPLPDAPAPVLAIRSHFYEFIDLDRPDSRPYLAHELEVKKTYEVVLSTGGGLLRYRTGDGVRVEGYYHNTPCLRFVGRVDEVSDLVGEKLSSTRANQVLTQAVNTTLRQPPRFLLLAPELSNPPHYRLFIDADLSASDLRSLCHVVETLLCEGYHYLYARDLGQLGPVQTVQVREGVRHYEIGCVQLGQRAGDIKPTALHRTTGWSTRLPEVSVTP